MGEIADAMLDGELCEWCGVDLGSNVGHTRRCGWCRHYIGGEDEKEEGLDEE